jgi:hypothetical protein
MQDILTRYGNGRTKKSSGGYYSQLSSLGTAGLEVVFG